MPPPTELIETGDGSHSLYSPELDETYHSRHGARQESQYVFIEKGLNFQKQRNPKELLILEVGMGTGLNVWLTLEESKRATLPIKMFTLEPYPISREIVNQLNYAPSNKQKQEFLNIHEGPWEKWVKLNQYFMLYKTKTPVLDFKEGNNIDLVYFDAFAPSKQKEMWELSLLSHIHQMMNIDGVFVTYCAQGQFKRNLKSLGFEIESLEGPPGKMEMVRAIKVR